MFGTFMTEQGKYNGSPLMNLSRGTISGGFMIEEISGDLVQWLRGILFLASKGGVGRRAQSRMGRRPADHHLPDQMS